MAAGRPVFAARAADTAELLDHGRNAYLVPPDDLVAAVAGLRDLLGNEAVARSLADAARIDAQALTWDARAHRIIEFMRRRLDAKGHHPRRHQVARRAGEARPTSPPSWTSAERV